MNFANPNDGALQAGLYLFWPLWKVSWISFQEDYKPIDGLNREYYSSEKNGTPIFYSVIRNRKGNIYSKMQVTDPKESIAFVGRSRSRALGAMTNAMGRINETVQLDVDFGFTSNRSDHSAQFNRDIQDVAGFYQRLIEELTP